jgi:hypothetical protein
VAEDGRDQLDTLGVGVAQVLGGVAQERAAVRREVDARLRLARHRLLVEALDLLAHHGLRLEGLGCRAHGLHRARAAPAAATLCFH